MGAGTARVGDAGVAADVVDLPERQRQAGAGEIGEALGAVPEPEAEPVDVEADRALDVLAEDADVADRVALGELSILRVLAQ